jgi:hypothetical protein
MTNGPIEHVAELADLPSHHSDGPDSSGEVEHYWSRPPAAARCPHPAGPSEAGSLAGLWIDLGGGD